MFAFCIAGYIEGLFYRQSEWTKRVIATAFLMEQGKTVHKSVTIVGEKRQREIERKEKDRQANGMKVKEKIRKKGTLRRFVP